MREAKRQYALDEKIELLLMVDQLGSLAAVEKATGVARATLRVWGDKYQQEVIKRKEILSMKTDTTMQLSTSINAQILCNHAAFLHKAFDIKNDALERMKHLISKSTNLKDVTGALNVLHAITITEKSDDPTSQSSRALYEQVLGMCPTVTNVQINNYGKDS